MVFMGTGAPHLAPGESRPISCFVDRLLLQRIMTLPCNPSTGTVQNNTTQLLTQECGEWTSSKYVAQTQHYIHEDWATDTIWAFFISWPYLRNITWHNNMTFTTNHCWRVSRLASNGAPFPESCCCLFQAMSWSSRKWPWSSLSFWQVSWCLSASCCNKLHDRSTGKLKKYLQRFRAVGTLSCIVARRWFLNRFSKFSRVYKAVWKKILEVKQSQEQMPSKYLESHDTSRIGKQNCCHF